MRITTRKVKNLFLHEIQNVSNCLRHFNLFPIYSYGAWNRFNSNHFKGAITTMTHLIIILCHRIQQVFSVNSVLYVQPHVLHRYVFELFKNMTLPDPVYYYWHSMCVFMAMSQAWRTLLMLHCTLVWLRGWSLWSSSSWPSPSTGRVRASMEWMSLTHLLLLGASSPSTSKLPDRVRVHCR